MGSDLERPTSSVGIPSCEAGVCSGATGGDGSSVAPRAPCQHGIELATDDAGGEFELFLLVSAAREGSSPTRNGSC